MITPQDIEYKEFSSSIKGYNRTEVDEFLDEINIDYQSLMSENAKLRALIDEQKEKLEEYKRAEGSVEETLGQAKRLMSDISASAEKKAESIIAKARQDADYIVKNAHSSVYDASEEYKNMMDRLSMFKERFRDLLQGEINRMDDFSDEFFGDLRNDFYSEPAQRIRKAGLPTNYDLNSSPGGQALTTTPAAGDEKADIPVPQKSETKDLSAANSEGLSLTDKVFAELNGKDYMPEQPTAEQSAKPEKLSEEDLSRETKVIKGGLR